MRFNGDYQVTQTLSIAKLTKHQRQQLVPTSEMLDILVTVILADEVIEVIPIKEIYQLSENVF